MSKLLSPPDNPDQMKGSPGTTIPRRPFHLDQRLFAKVPIADAAMPVRSSSPA